MAERLRFVARLIEGEAMTELCREFGISRKTGYSAHCVVNTTEEQEINRCRVERC